MEHIALPIFMRCVDTSLHCAINALAEKNAIIIAAPAEHDAEKALLQAQIHSLQAELPSERVKNMEIV